MLVRKLHVLCYVTTLEWAVAYACTENRKQTRPFLKPQTPCAQTPTLARNKQLCKLYANSTQTLRKLYAYSAHTLRIPLLCKHVRVYFCNYNQRSHCSYARSCQHPPRESHRPAAQRWCARLVAGARLLHSLLQHMVRVLACPRYSRLALI
jgi:hypothetical protein